MKKLGFIDYYLSEWHANNYPKFIKKACDELGYDYGLQYAWAEKYESEVDGKNTDQWCEQMGAIRCETIEELCENSDAIIIFAPSNPEKHLEYAKKVFPFGKPVSIDKSFADTIEDAEEIFALANKYGVKFFSASALRYATELDEVGPCVAMTTIGGYSPIEEYIIHQAEMIVKKLGNGAKEIKAQKITNDQYTFTIKYDDERRAGMHIAKSGAPFCVLMDTGDGSDALYKVVESDIFYGMIKDILTLFETGACSFDASEILEVNRIMVSAIKAKEQPDTWIKI